MPDTQDLNWKDRMTPTGDSFDEVEVAALELARAANQLIHAGRLGGRYRGQSSRAISNATSTGATFLEDQPRSTKQDSRALSEPESDAGHGADVAQAFGAHELVGDVLRGGHWQGRERTEPSRILADGRDGRVVRDTAQAPGLLGGERLGSGLGRTTRL